MTLLVVLHIGLAAWLGGCTLLLAKAGPLLHTPRLRRVLGRVTGVVLIGFGVVVAPRPADPAPAGSPPSSAAAAYCRAGTRLTHTTNGYLP
jgi:hypothetical protein